MTQPVPTMPPAEAELLEAAYAEAEVILEYGSGASTRIAAAMPGKYILSVESDPAWARQLRQDLAASGPASPATVYHVDIGRTGAWGRPLDDSRWRNYHRYPNAIWDEPFFRHPDVVLIDGRFRIACMMAVILHATRPVRVLFDDYDGRPKYRRVEKLLRPGRMAGRMAEFTVPPGLVSPQNIGYMIAQFFDVSLSDGKKANYELTAAEQRMLRSVALESDAQKGMSR